MFGPTTTKTFKEDVHLIEELQGKSMIQEISLKFNHVWELLKSHY